MNSNEAVRIISKTEVEARFGNTWRNLVKLRRLFGHCSKAGILFTVLELSDRDGKEGFWELVFRRRDDSRYSLERR